MVAIGDKAPAFSLPTSGGQLIESEALKGQPYLVYFYPKADTPGCTTQACDLRDQKQTLGTLGSRSLASARTRSTSSTGLPKIRPRLCACERRAA